MHVCALKGAYLNRNLPIKSNVRLCSLLHCKIKKNKKSDNGFETEKPRAAVCKDDAPSVQIVRNQRATHMAVIS